MKTREKKEEKMMHKLGKTKKAYSKSQETQKSKGGRQLGLT